MQNASGKKVLSGWKEIENFLGMKRKTILQVGYPIRKLGGTVVAVPEELLKFILSKPGLNLPE